MNSIQIQLDPVAMREATAQAIVGILTPEVRAQILERAISGLLSPSSNSWDRGRSPIQEAFDNAVAKVAHEIAHEHVKSDASIVNRLRELVKQTAEKVLNTDPEHLSQKLAQAFVDGLRASGHDR